MFARDPEHLPARRENPHLRSRPQHLVRQVGRTSDEMLAVVQNQENAALAQVVAHDGERIPRRLRPDRQRVDEHVRQQSRVFHRPQLHQAHPVRKSPLRLPGRTQSQPGLADPPIPVNVTSRAAARSFRTAATSCRRPTKLVRSTGTVLGNFAIGPLHALDQGRSYVAFPLGSGHRIGLGRWCSAGCLYHPAGRVRLGIWALAIRPRTDRIVNLVVPPAGIPVLVDPLIPVPFALTAVILASPVAVLVWRPPVTRDSGAYV